MGVGNITQIIFTNRLASAIRKRNCWNKLNPFRESATCNWNPFFDYISSNRNMKEHVRYCSLQDFCRSFVISQTFSNSNLPTTNKETRVLESSHVKSFEIQSCFHLLSPKKGLGLELEFQTHFWN